MEKLKYDKLIRDKIPEIIKKSGKDLKIEKMDEKEHLMYLNKKLQEELDEYYDEYSIEELCDLVEVIYGILKLKDISIQDFHTKREKKSEERGSFDEGLKLLEVMED